MQSTDYIQKFLFDAHPVSGQWIQLEDSFQTIMTRHRYPPVLQRLLAEALIAVLALNVISKHDGNIALQFQGDGKLKLLSVRVTSTNKVRGLVQWDGEIVSDESLTRALGAGRLVITYSPGASMQQYQSIVEVNGASIAEAMERYFAQSVQREIRLKIAFDRKKVIGLMLQLMPESDMERQQVSWQHVTTLLDTVQDDELLNLSYEQVLMRLYVEDPVRLLTPQQPVAFGCSCSIDKMQNAVFQMGKDEAQKILDEHETVEVSCDFCGMSYDFDEDDISGLFREH